MSPALWAITGWTLVALAGVMLARGLWPDRARGRRRCPRCWYDMTGAPSLICPECGRAARSERDLRRARRRWPWAVGAAAVGLLGTQLADQAARVRESWWLRMVPSSVLVMTARFDDQDWFNALPAWKQEWHRAVWYRPMLSWQRAAAEWRALPLDEQDVRAMVIVPAEVGAGHPLEVLIAPPPEAYGVMGARARTIDVRWLRSPDVVAVIDVGVGAPMGEWAYQPARAWSPRRDVARASLRLPGREPGEYRDQFEVVIRNEHGWVLGRWRVAVLTRVVGEGK